MFCDICNDEKETHRVLSCEDSGLVTINICTDCEDSEVSEEEDYETLRG